MNSQKSDYYLDFALYFYKRKTEPKTGPLKGRKAKPAENQRVSKIVSGERGTEPSILPYFATRCYSLFSFAESEAPLAEGEG